MTDRLKPCPFCGGDNVGIWECRVFASKDFRYSANCYDCHISLGFEETKEEAIEKWNTRKPMDRIVERLEAEAERWYASGKEFKDKTELGVAGGFRYAIEIIKDGKDNEK